MNAIIEDFRKHGMDASYHYADDSGSEWHQGAAEERAALELFDANPDLQGEMREVAKGFLWSLNMVRPVNDS